MEDKVNQPKIFSIPDYNMPIVELKIAKLNTRALKLGAEPIQIVIIKKWDRVIRYPFDDDHILSAGEVKEIIPTTDIQVIGKAPQLNGWTLVAVAEPAVGGILLRKFPDVDLEIPLEFRDVSPDRCDHCHTNRKRNETFIVYHAVNGWKVVGRTCLADFTGINNPEKIANYASALFDLMVGIEDDERIGNGGGNNGGYYCAPIRSFLRVVAIWSGRHGFVTSKMAKESEHPIMPTGKEVFQEFFVPNFHTDHAAIKSKFYESITDKESEDADDLVDAAMQWGKTQFVDEKEENLSDYGHNMKLLLAADYVRIIDVGFVASVIPGYKRFIQPKTKRIIGKSHVGTIGEKITTTITVHEVFPWTGQYGLVNITTFITDDGNLLTWFAPPEKKMIVGEYKTMVAKVKRHDDRNGSKSTVVTYPKFI